MSMQATDPVGAEPAWPVFMVKLLSRREVADGTMAFEFQKPTAWRFDAGQFVDVTLLNPRETDSEGDTRHFSLASAPFEDRLMIATRMRNTAFKRVLKTLPLGSEVKIEGPFGDLRLHNNVARPAVIVSGGIGITPFRSILEQAVHDNRKHRIWFFYANRRPEDAIFLEDMQALTQASAKITFIPTMTGMDKSQLAWNGERGRIDQQLLSKYLTGITLAIYYVTGPPAMVKGLRTLLEATGVDRDDIRTEEFTGY